MTPSLFSEAQLDELIHAACHSPRLRMNFNMHPDSGSTVQRLFNAMEPRTYIRAHRHARPNGWELMLAIRGHFDLLLFDETGRVTCRYHMESDGGQIAVEVPPRTWHTVISRAPGTVMFEIKEGPYLPVPPEDFAPWAPDPENKPLAMAFLDWAENARPGEGPPL